MNFQLNENCFRYNFNLEVLHGCRWSCVGCYVNRKEDMSPKIDDIKKLKKLSKSIEESSYIPSILIIGPTDIFTANNSHKLFDDKEFVSLCLMYERLTFNSTFEYLDLELIEKINTLFPTLEIEFKIVIDIPKFDDDEHLGLVRDNYLKCRKLLTKVKRVVIHPQLNLFNAPLSSLEKKLTDYVHINKRSYKYFDQGVDYGVSFGRRDEVSFKYQRNAFNLLKKTFNEVFANDVDLKNIHFDASRSQDINENVFSFKHGRIYFAPKIYDEYVNFYDRYHIDMPSWTFSDLKDYQDNLLITQYESSKKLICSDCDNLPNCVNKGILDFMNHLDYDGCIFASKAFKKYHPDKNFAEKTRSVTNLS